MQDVAELEALLEAVGVGGLAVAADELEAAAHVVRRAQVVGVARVVVGWAPCDGRDCGCRSGSLGRG